MKMDMNTIVDITSAQEKDILSWAKAKKYEQIGIMIGEMVDNIITPKDFLTGERFAKKFDRKKLQGFMVAQLKLDMGHAGVPDRVLNEIVSSMLAAMTDEMLREEFVEINEAELKQEILAAKRKGLNVAIPFHTHPDMDKLDILNPNDCEQFGAWHRYGTKVKMNVPSGIAATNDIRFWNANFSEGFVHPIRHEVDGVQRR